MVNYPKIIQRIQQHKGFSSEKQVALEIGLSGADLSKRKKTGTNTLLAIITEWGINQKLNLDWLLTGEGFPYIKGGEGIIDADPEINSLLAMTRTILGSETGFSGSLRANIRSFFEAVQTQKKFENLEQRLSELERDRGGGENGGGCCQTQALLAPKITKKGRSAAT